MAITNVQFVPGAIIDKATMKTELDRVRGWVNSDGALVIADIQGGEVTHQHVYRPELFGFPKRSIESVVQHVYDRHFGINLDNAGRIPRLVLRQERETIFLRFLSDNDEHFLGNMQGRIRVRAVTAEVEIAVSWMCTTSYDFVASAEVYPNEGGDFVLALRNVDTGVETVLTESIREIYPRHDASGVDIEVNTYSTGAYVESLAKGDYDVYLKYRRNDANAEITQVIVFDQNCVAQVHSN